MKTVQSWLQQVDDRKLAETWIRIHPIDYESKDMSKTVEEIRRAEISHFRLFVTMMQRIELFSDCEERIFFASRLPTNEWTDIEVFLCKTEDMKNQETPAASSWISMSTSEIMGFKIAETELTTANILTVLAKILDDASFYGYSEGDKELAHNLILENTKDDPTSQPLTQEIIHKRLGLQNAAHDEMEEKLRSDMLKAERAYIDYFYKKEVAKVKSLLSTT